MKTPTVTSVKQFFASNALPFAFALVAVCLIYPQVSFAADTASLTPQGGIPDSVKGIAGVLIRYVYWIAMVWIVLKNLYEGITTGDWTKNGKEAVLGVVVASLIAYTLLGALSGIGEKIGTDIVGK